MRQLKVLIISLGVRLIRGGVTGNVQKNSSLWVGGGGQS